jgi:hypothetical protein
MSESLLSEEDIEFYDILFNVCVYHLYRTLLIRMEIAYNE